jgi:hypothetical protein
MIDGKAVRTALAHHRSVKYIKKQNLKFCFFCHLKRFTFSFVIGLTARFSSTFCLLHIWFVQSNSALLFLALSLDQDANSFIPKKEASTFTHFCYNRNAEETAFTLYPFFFS